MSSPCKTLIILLLSLILSSCRTRKTALMIQGESSVHDTSGEWRTMSTMTDMAATSRVFLHDTTRISWLVLPDSHTVVPELIVRSLDYEEHTGSEYQEGGSEASLHVTASSDTSVTIRNEGVTKRNEEDIRGKSKIRTLLRRTLVLLAAALLLLLAFRQIIRRLVS